MHTAVISFNNERCLKFETRNSPVKFRTPVRRTATLELDWSGSRIYCRLSAAAKKRSLRKPGSLMAVAVAVVAVAVVAVAAAAGCGRTPCTD
jgi:hypothetical protein